MWTFFPTDVLPTTLEDIMEEEQNVEQSKTLQYNLFTERMINCT